ncbi:diphthine--ammonia ligase [Thiothrix winogradskyi]|uniref:Diphthine--ammonia ligase n=1 Tax=Thiothrix winogradskyi TaxID=96472 RepID=A0ABY3SZD2_9GAMM|nr:diphthine--ammonia ligase [Thiothrix winogradskyi]UJS24490.1 diphthine--ammonia ligase [Thiothrix winogradskyi]
MKLISSWSGGKDACLALYRAMQAGHQPQALLTMMEADGLRTRAHALPLAVLRQQAAALGLPLITPSVTWEGYRPMYVQALSEAKAQGAEALISGDIDLQAHRDWLEQVGEEVGLNVLFPLWKDTHSALLEEFHAVGFTTHIIAVKLGVLDESWLGRKLDAAAMQELDAIGVDVCGEGGEFHTFVTDGPLFSHPLNIQALGSFTGKHNYTFLNFTLV